MDELLAAATHRTKAEIEELIAQRFPGTELMALVQPLPAPRTEANEQHAPAHVDGNAASRFASQHAPAHVEVSAPRPRVSPLAMERFAIQFTIGKDTNDLLQEAQALLSHAVPSGDLAAVFHRALEALVPQLQKQKFAATSKPRRSRRRSAGPRRIPANVKRAVWERDRGRCTFVGENGHRCGSRKFLEFDHADPVARGGRATVDGVRLRCRAHNQLEAERTFGAEFMSYKREAARRATVEARSPVTQVETGKCVESPRLKTPAPEHTSDVFACLRNLGCRADEAQRAVESTRTIPDATLEQRVRAALQFLGPKPRFRARLGSPEALPSHGAG